MYKPQVQLAQGVSMEALNKSLADATAANNEALLKATFTQNATATQGLQAYDLEPVAKLMYPVLTPLRNKLPRVGGNGGSQANWKAVTGINTAKLGGGVGQGNRGGQIALSTKEYAAIYRTQGFESDASFEAVAAGDTFADIRGLAALTGLQSTMLYEELAIVGGNRTLALGTTPTPSVANTTTGGNLAAATYSVICVALSLEGRVNATVATGVQGLVSRTNADGSVDTYGGGAARKSTAATTTTTGSTSKITATVAPVAGAVAYAWYWGAAGSEVLGAITGYAGVTITAAAAGTQAASSLAATDYSTNDLIYDGMLSMAFNTSLGSYWKDLGGATLTSDGAGGIVEIDAILQRYWNVLRMAPTDMWINAREAATLNAALTAGVANGAYRINVNAEQGAMMGGLIIKTYLNKYGMGGVASTININIHPNIPQGVILFTADTVPYPMSDVRNLMQIKTRQDYYQIEWPLRTRKYEYGVYTDSVFQHYFPPSLAVLTGIGQYQEGAVIY